MAGLPPLSAEPGTPAHEWAAKTTSALEPNPDAPSSTFTNPTTQQLFEEKNLRPGTIASGAPGTVSSVPYAAGQGLETPGREVPGAFPRDDELQDRGAEISQAMADTANRAAQTASTLAQSVQETAATYLPKAAETVGHYLPKSVVDTMSAYIRE